MTQWADDATTVNAAEHPPLTFSRWVAGVISRWRIIMAGIGAVALLAVAALFLIPPIYTASAAFVTNSSSPSLNLGGAMSGLRGMGGFASQLGIGRPADPSESPKFYTQLIGSRELRTRLLETKFANPRTEAPGDSAKLIDILRIKNKDPERKRELAIKALAQSMRTTHDEETNLVTLKVTTEWRHLSAAMANRTLDLLAEFNREQRTSRASSKRNFLDRRTALARSDLLTAEARQRSFYEQNRSWKSSPTLVLQEENLQREVDRAADLQLALQQQLEAARIEEVNDAALITVVDSSVAPRKAAWPRYGILTVTTVVAGTLVGTMLAGILVILADWRARNPGSASQLGGTVRSARREIGSALTGRARAPGKPPDDRSVGNL